MCHRLKICVGYLFLEGFTQVCVNFSYETVREYPNYLSISKRVERISIENPLELTGEGDGSDTQAPVDAAQSKEEARVDVTRQIIQSHAVHDPPIKPVIRQDGRQHQSETTKKVSRSTFRPTTNSSRLMFGQTNELSPPTFRQRNNLSKKLSQVTISFV